MFQTRGRLPGPGKSKWYNCCLSCYYPREFGCNCEKYSFLDAIALVEYPAIEENFFTFKKETFKSYSDYPKAVSAAAERGIRLNEKVNNKCATRVGKIRATQLAAEMNPGTWWIRALNEPEGLDSHERQLQLCADLDCPRPIPVFKVRKNGGLID